jgi:hypothetical protein
LPQEKTQIDVDAFDEHLIDDIDESVQALEEAQRIEAAMLSIKSADGYPVLLQKMDVLRRLHLELGVYDRKRPRDWYEGFLEGFEASKSMIEQYTVNELIQERRDELKYWKALQAATKSTPNQDPKAPGKSS